MLTVAIPTFNREEILIETIKYFEKLENIYELIIVDQTKEHKTFVNQELTRLNNLGKINLVKLNYPSLTKAKNIALSICKSEFLLFVDDDVIPSQEMLDEHFRIHTLYPKVAIVAGSAIQEENSFIIEEDILVENPNKLGFVKINGRILPNKMMPRYKGCNHSVKTDIVKSLGGYDERYFGVAMCEETDLSISVLEANKSIYLSSKASLYHLAFPSGGCRKKSLFDTSATYCICLFAFKNIGFLGLQSINEIKRALQNLILNKTVKSKPYFIPILGFLFICTLIKALLSTLKLKAIVKLYA